MDAILEDSLRQIKIQCPSEDVWEAFNRLLYKAIHGHNPLKNKNLMFEEKDILSSTRHEKPVEILNDIWANSKRRHYSISENSGKYPNAVIIAVLNEIPYLIDGGNRINRWIKEGNQKCPANFHVLK